MKVKYGFAPNDTDGATTVDEEETVAYTVGSIWYCTGCGPRFDANQRVTADNMLDIYEYRCDHCDHVIKKASVG